MENEFVKILQETKKLREENRKIDTEMEKVKRKLDDEKFEIIEKLKEFFNHKIIQDFLLICLKERLDEEQKQLNLKKEFIETKGGELVNKYDEIMNFKPKKEYKEYYTEEKVSKYIDDYFAYCNNSRQRPGGSLLITSESIAQDEWYRVDCERAGEKLYKEELKEALDRYRKYPNEKIEDILTLNMMGALIKYCDYQGNIVKVNYKRDLFYIIDKDKVIDIALGYNIIAGFKDKYYPYSVVISSKDLNEIFENSLNNKKKKKNELRIKMTGK